MGQCGGGRMRKNMRLPAGWLPTVCAGPKGSAAPLFTLKRAFFSQQIFWLENKCSFDTRLAGHRNLSGLHAKLTVSLPEGECSPVLCAGLRRYVNERDAKTCRDCTRS